MGYHHLLGFFQPKFSQLLRFSKLFQAIFEGHGVLLALAGDDGHQFERPMRPHKPASCAFGMSVYALLDVIGDANVKSAAFAMKCIDRPW